MIHGIGTDIVDINRIKATLGRFGCRFAKRFLAAEEFEIFLNQPKHMQDRFLAKRFSAKEAVAKAMGTGFRNGMAFNQIIVRNDRLGKPEVFLEGKALKIANEKGVSHIYISLSDEKNYAIAYVVMSKG